MTYSKVQAELTEHLKLITPMILNKKELVKLSVAVGQKINTGLVT